MTYWISRAIILIFLKIFFRFSVSGRENIPEQGGFILAPNHVSYFDPPAVGSACPRKVHFMAKQELFEVPVLKYWMRAVSTFPVRRGQADRGALRKAVEILQRGDVVCVFPEGRRVAPGAENKGDSGVILIAQMAGVPVVPMAIVGTQPLFRKNFPWFSSIEIRFGKPLFFERDGDPKKRSEVINESLNLLMSKIKALKSGTHDEALKI